MYKIKNIGKTKTFVYNGMNNRVKKNDIEWSIDYDNKNGVDLNVNMDNNGDKSHYHQYLTNSELEELLKMPVVNKSIHQRLLEDFNPYSNTNYSNKNLDLITYPHQKSEYPYTMHNDLINSDLYNNQLPLILQQQQQASRQSLKKTPKIIRIKIYTKKHRLKDKKHSDSRSNTKSNTSRNSRKHSRTSSQSRSRTKSH
jgi:hypothetical protein